MEEILEETKKQKAWQDESVHMTNHTDTEQYNYRKKCTVHKDVYEYLEQGVVLQGQEAGLQRLSPLVCGQHQEL